MIAFDLGLAYGHEFREKTGIDISKYEFAPHMDQPISAARAGRSAAK